MCRPECRPAAPGPARGRHIRNKEGRDTSAPGVSQHTQSDQESKERGSLLRQELLPGPGLVHQADAQHLRGTDRAGEDSGILPHPGRRQEDLGREERHKADHDSEAPRDQASQRLQPVQVQQPGAGADRIPRLGHCHPHRGGGCGPCVPPCGQVHVSYPHGQVIHFIYPRPLCSHNTFQVAEDIPLKSDPRGGRGQVHQNALDGARPPGDLPGPQAGTHGEQLLLQLEQGILLR